MGKIISFDIINNNDVLYINYWYKINTLEDNVLPIISFVK